MSGKIALDSALKSGDNNNRSKKVRLVVGKSSDQFKKVRCKKCGRLLYRQLVKSVPLKCIEIKCGKCGAITVQ